MILVLTGLNVVGCSGAETAYKTLYLRDYSSSLTLVCPEIHSNLNQLYLISNEAVLPQLKLTAAAFPSNQFPYKSEHLGTAS